MFNWIELNKGDLGWLFVAYRKVKHTDKLEKYWEMLYDEYINEIGLTDDFVELIEAMKRATILIVDAIQHPTSLNVTKAEAAKELVERLSTGGKDTKFGEFVAAVEKYMGIPINFKTISVERFYSYVRLMEKESKAIQAN